MVVQNCSLHGPYICEAVQCVSFACRSTRFLAFGYPWEDGTGMALHRAIGWKRRENLPEETVGHSQAQVSPNLSLA